MSNETEKLTNLPRIVSRAEWQQARDQLLVKEKAATGLAAITIISHWFVCGRFLKERPLGHHYKSEKFLVLGMMPNR